MEYFFKRQDLKDQSLCHIPCIFFFKMKGEASTFPASILLHPIVLLRTACVFPVSLSKFHFFDYLLEFNISSVTDYVCLCMLTVSTQRYIAWTSFQTGLTCPAVGNAVSREPELPVFCFFFFFEDLPQLQRASSPEVMPTESCLYLMTE